MRVMSARSLLMTLSLATLVDASALAQKPDSRAQTRRASGVRTPSAQEAIAAIVAAAAPATVTILALGRLGDTLAQGSGFVVRSDGVIVTNAHVLRGASGALVMMPGRATFTEVAVLGADSVIDLAVLKVAATGLPALIARNDLPEPGERVVAIGSPLGLPQTVSDGIVSATRLMQGRELVQISAPISPGSSGGAVLDDQGRVFAVSTPAS